MVSSPDINLDAESGIPRAITSHEEEKTRSDSAEIVELSDEEDISYPEGGLEAWLVVCGSFCGM